MGAGVCVQVYIATSTESDAILAQLDIDIDNATEKMKELAKLNVTRRVCDVLATHNTEKKVGGKALEDTVLEDALLVSQCIANTAQQKLIVFSHEINNVSS